MRFTSARLGDLGVIVGGGTPGTSMPGYWGGDIPWVTPKDLSSLRGRYVTGGERAITADGLANSAARVIPAGSVLLSSRAPIGLVGIAAVPLSTNQGCRSFVPGPLVDPGYAYYRFLTMSEDFIARASGSTFMEISGSALADVPFYFPPLREQKAIAEVLGALDDKIAANTALAATADALIRAEYASLSSRRVRVSEVASSPRSGVDPSLVKPHDLYVGLEHIGRRQMWLADGGEAAEVTSTKSRFEAGDVLFGKLRPYFHKVVSAPRSGICSTDILVVRPKDAQLASLLLAALTSDAVIEEVVSASEGTRMPRTSWKDLAAVEIWWPGPNEVESFTGRLDAVRESTIAVIAENRTLAATRDALLPQLMSGKLRVRDAEEMIAQAGV